MFLFNVERKIFLMTNEVIENMVNRRSIRKYKPEQIKDEELQAVIKAGEYAPNRNGYAIS